MEVMFCLSSCFQKYLLNSLSCATPSTRWIRKIIISSGTLLLALSFFSSYITLQLSQRTCRWKPSFSENMFSWCRHYRAHMWIRDVADEKWSGMRAVFVSHGFISIGSACTWLLMHNVNKPRALKDTWIQHRYFPHCF